jgi:hypothetical protein
MGVQETGASTTPASHQAGCRCGCKAAALLLMVHAAWQHQVMCHGRQRCSMGRCALSQASSSVAVVAAVIHASVHACMPWLHTCSSCCADASARRPHCTASDQAQCQAPAHHLLAPRRWQPLAAVDYVICPPPGLVLSLPLPQVMVAGGRWQGPLWTASMGSPRGGAACKPGAPEAGTPNSTSHWHNQRECTNVAEHRIGSYSQRTEL